METTMKSDYGVISWRPSFVRPVLLLAAVGMLPALAPTTAFSWVPSKAVERRRRGHDLAPRTSTGLSATAAAKPQSHAVKAVVNHWLLGTKSKNVGPEQAVAQALEKAKAWREHIAKLPRLSTIRKKGVKTTRAMAAAAVLMVALFLSPLSANAAESGDVISGSGKRDAAIQSVSKRSDPSFLSPSLPGRLIKRHRVGGS